MRLADFPNMVIGMLGSLIAPTEICDAGSAPLNGVCAFCPIGTYSLAGDPACTQCPLGFSAPVNSVSAAACYPIVAAGKHQNMRFADFPANIKVTGSHAADVAPVVSGGGSIQVMNNGAHVAANQTGSGSIVIQNNGQVMAAINIGTGTMIINSDATGAVAVTRTGNGNTYVTAHGSSAIAYVVNGDGDVTYPNQLNSDSAHHAGVGLLTNPNIQISGSNPSTVTPSLNGGGSIQVENNGAFVTATENGAGRIDITNNGAGVTATNTGTGLMTINNQCTAAVTITRLGNGNTYVTATGSVAITHTIDGDQDATISN
jgi:hypothetical protein